MTAVVDASRSGPAALRTNGPAAGHAVAGHAVAGHAVAGPGWAPSSPCDAGCVPSAATGPVTALRVARRATALLTVLPAVAVTGCALPLLGNRGRAAWLRWAAGSILEAAGVTLTVRGDRLPGGTITEGGTLLVANHRSWVEVLALAAVAPVRLVAKRELRHWPLVGAIAAAAGTVFVERDAPRSLPAAVDAVAATLRAGHTVAVFPEGTTWCGAAAGPFRRAFFQSAIDAGAPVRPVAVVLRTDGAHSPIAAFVGPETLAPALLRVLGSARTECTLTVQPLLSPHRDRAALAAAAAGSIAAVTGVAHPRRGSRPAQAPAAA